jgi:hypothetical protein
LRHNRSMSQNPEPPRASLSLPAGLLVLLSRGVLLWLVVPIAFITWLFALSWRRTARATLGECVGWFDVNLVAFLQTFVFSPLIPEPLAHYLPWSEMRGLLHRTRLLRDLY